MPPVGEKTNILIQCLPGSNLGNILCRMQRHVVFPKLEITQRSPRLKTILVFQQLLRLQGKRLSGREEINIIDVCADDRLDPSELTKNITEETDMMSHSKKKNKDLPSSQQKRKHQITYLAFKVGFSDHGKWELMQFVLLLCDSSKDRKDAVCPPIMWLLQGLEGKLLNDSGNYRGIHRYRKYNSWLGRCAVDEIVCSAPQNCTLASADQLTPSYETGKAWCSVSLSILQPPANEVKLLYRWSIASPAVMH